MLRPQKEIRKNRSSLEPGLMDCFMSRHAASFEDQLVAESFGSSGA